jgi:hypothetical protein
MSMEKMGTNPYQGKLNEAALMEQRDKNIDIALERFVSRKVVEKAIKSTIEEDGLEAVIREMSELVFEKIQQDHNINYRSSDKDRREVREEYPDEIIRKKCKAWISTNFPQ